MTAPFSLPADDDFDFDRLPPREQHSIRVVQESPAVSATATEVEKHPLVRAAEALEAEAELPRNRKHRWAYLTSAAHYREEAKRLPAMATGAS